ncbi:MAG TPA: transglycosylase domain-containing protein [Mycobacteriales bacterium]|nr:transglycosylase domain-containing protein [Mycobacteriales bacterium]
MAGSVGRKILGVAQLGGAIGVAGVLVAAVLLPFTGGLGLVARNSVRAFDEQPCDVDPGAPAQRSVMLAANGGPAIATFYSQNREVVPYSDIPDVMRKAIIAIEDRRFLEHHGVDTEALLRAVVKNSQSGSVVQGGSTLTMQYIKNVRLYSAKTDAEQRTATEQTSARKLIEARCALELEHKLSKDEILGRYLNITYFGASAYGVQMAARTYFGKPAKQLTLPEAALLAGLVQSPSRFDPYRSKKLAKDRRDVVLTEMQSLGYINAKQAAQAKATPIAVVPKRPSSLKDCANASPKIANAGFFCDYVKSYLTTIGFPQQRIDAGGYTIYTTLNGQIQNRVQAAMPYGRWLNRKSVAVMDVLDPKTGKVLAFGVSRKYGVNPKDPNVTSDPLNVKAAAGAGSTYKTYTLVSALESKTPLRDYKIGVGDTYTSKVCSNYKDGQKVPYEVKNAGTYGNGPWNLETATYESVNTFFVALLDQRFNCDLSGPVKAALRLGLNSFKPYAKATIDGKSASFTLGPDPTSPLDIASSYGTLANRGVYCPPSPVEKIVGPDGKAIALPERACERRVSQGIADTVTNVLEKDTSKRGGTAVSAFAGLAGGSHPIAGKTGTASALVNQESSGNSAAWFIGYTPDLVASVAVYNQKKSTEPLVDVPDKEGGNVFGAYSATIWRAALEPILLQRGGWSFPPEDPEVVNGDTVGVPSVVGLDPATATGILQASGFQVTIAPERKDSPVPAGLVAEQSPSGRGSRGQMIFLYLSSGKQPAAPGGSGAPGDHGRPRPGPPGGGGGG